jgi:hypothetical protein
LPCLPSMSPCRQPTPPPCARLSSHIRDDSIPPQVIIVDAVDATWLYFISPSINNSSENDAPRGRPTFSVATVRSERIKSRVYHKTYNLSEEASTSLAMPLYQEMTHQTPPSPAMTDVGLVFPSSRASDCLICNVAIERSQQKPTETHKEHGGLRPK